MNGHKSDSSREALRIDIYNLLSKRMGVDESLNNQGVKVVDFLSEKAEQMVFPIDRKQAICLITLIFCYLNEEWHNAGCSEDLPCLNRGNSTEWFMAGAKRIYTIIKGTARGLQQTGTVNGI